MIKREHVSSQSWVKPKYVLFSLVENLMFLVSYDYSEYASTHSLKENRLKVRHSRLGQEVLKNIGSIPIIPIRKKYLKSFRKRLDKCQEVWYNSYSGFHFTEYHKKNYREKENKIMNKVELVNALREETGMMKKDVIAMLDAFTNVVAKTLAKKEEIKLVGFGTFKITEREAREARNPQNGEVIQVPAKTVPKFKAGKMLKDAVK